MAWRYVEARDAGAPLPRRILSVWRHRRLLRRMAERELRLRYAGAALGVAWATVSPLIFVAVYVGIFTFVFGGRLGPGAPTAQYALYVVAGLLPWVAFADVAGRSTQTMAEHRGLVKFVVFPLQILPLSSLYVTALSQIVGLIVVLAMATALQGGPPPGLWLLPLVLVLEAVFLAGVAWLLGAVGAVFRDVREIVQVVLMVGMFLTPIFYLEQDLPRPLRAVIALNPLTHLVRIYRDAVLGQGVGHPASVAVFGAVAVATLFTGFVVFERTRALLSDLL